VTHVLVTGGAGFVGSHLVDRLLADGLEVTVVDNLSTGEAANLTHARSHDDFNFVEHELTDPYFPDRDVDRVYHLASPASPEDYRSRPIHTMKVGAQGTLHMLGLAKSQDAKLLLASTSEVYGDPEVNPQPEEYWGSVNPIGPRGVYDEAKRFAEALTMAYHRKHGVNTRIARIFNTYGPRMRPDDGRAIPNFLRQSLSGEPITVYGDGQQTRSFCFVDDTVEGLVRLMRRGDEEPVNIGNPDERTILDLAETIRSLMDSESEITFHPLPENDPEVRRPDISRARKLLDWGPTVPLEEGLTRTLKAMKGPDGWIQESQI
jgi:dTDP-glucose 4,6-dehydratase